MTDQEQIQDDGEHPKYEWIFYAPEPCLYREQSFTLSPQMKLAFYRVIFPGLVEAFEGKLN